MASEDNSSPSPRLAPAAAEPSPSPVQPEENNEPEGAFEDAESFHSGGEDFGAEQDEEGLLSEASAVKDHVPPEGEVLGGGVAVAPAVDGEESGKVGEDGTGFDAVEASVSPGEGVTDPSLVEEGRGITKDPELNTSELVSEGGGEEEVVSPQNSDESSEPSSNLKGEPAEVVLGNGVFPEDSGVQEVAVVQKTPIADDVAQTFSSDAVSLQQPAIPSANSEPSSNMEGEPLVVGPGTEGFPEDSSSQEAASAEEPAMVDDGAQTLLFNEVIPEQPSISAELSDTGSGLAKSEGDDVSGASEVAGNADGGIYKDSREVSSDVVNASGGGGLGSDGSDQHAEGLASPVIKTVEPSDSQDDATTTVEDPIPEAISVKSIPIAADNAEEVKEKPLTESVQPQTDLNGVTDQEIEPLPSSAADVVVEEPLTESVQPQADLNGVAEEVEPPPSSAADVVVEDAAPVVPTYQAREIDSSVDIDQGAKPINGVSNAGNGQVSLEPAEVGQEGKKEITEKLSVDTVAEPKVGLNGAVKEADRADDCYPTSTSPDNNGVADLTGDEGDLSTIKAKEGFSADDDDEKESGQNSEGPAKVVILDSSEAAKQLFEELGEGSSDANSALESSRDFSPQIDGQIVTDSDEEAETDDEGDGKELFDSAALAALLRAASGASSDGNVTVSAADASRIFSVDRPAGLGFSAPSLRPGPARSLRSNLVNPSELAAVGETDNMDEEEKKLHEKVDNIRVKFLRLVHRLGHSPEDTVAAQVLYRLGLAEGIKRGRPTSRIFGIDSAKKKALQLEESGDEPLEFSCNILVLGKTGVGKSSTINSIFGEQVAGIDAFQPATTCVKEIVGVVEGVKIRFIDTPGLRPSVMDQSYNRKILSSIKKHTKKCPPDIVLYVDRLDTQTRDLNDLPLLRSIASTLGSSIWFNAIVALTHAASAPPDGPNGTPLSYDVFVAQRSHIVQHSIRQAAGDMRLMNPVALVENHSSCRRNRLGQRVLPNGIAWRPQLLLLCYSSKTLSEANSLLKLQDPYQGKIFGFRTRSPPLPYLLSSLLQTRAHPKAATDQGGDLGDSDVDLGELSDSDQEEEDEYDQLPPFKPLKKSQIAMLTKEQRKAYFDEYDYRVKLLQKKQWKEELKRLKELKKRGKVEVEEPLGYGEADDYDQDAVPAAVPVPLPDMVLPPTFDGDNPAYRYRFLEPTSTLLARPVLDTHGWDHDCGYDGVSLEENLALAGRYPANVAVQITKDKKEFNVHLDSSIAAKHGENGSTLAGFDIQSVGKQLAYILRSETKFKNLKKNKTAAGISVTFLGENIATGLKVEDQVTVGKRLTLGGSTGAVRAQGDVAYGANLEVRLREKDYPIAQDVSTLGLSLMKWRGDLALGANLQSQFSLGRNTKTSVRVGLNNKSTGQITVRTSSSEQLQLALLGVIPIAMSIFRSIWPGESYLVQ